MSLLDTVVYIIQDGQIIESKIRDLHGYIEETTTPLGIAPKYHLRGKELWTWGTNGNFQKIINKIYQNQLKAFLNHKK